MTKKIKLLILYSCLFFISDKAIFAHEPNHDEWNPVSAGPLTTWTAPLCGQNKLVVQPFFFYNKTRGAYDERGLYNSLAEGDQQYQFQQQIFAQYGLTDRLEIDAQIIYQQNYLTSGGIQSSSSGLGDSNLFIRYCLLEEQDWFPNLTALAQLKVPTGKYQTAQIDKQGTDIMGSGSWDHQYGIILTKKIKPFLLHLDTVYNFPLETEVDGLRTLYGQYVNFDFGIEYFLPKGFSLLLEMNGLSQGNTKQNGLEISNSNLNYLILAPGIGWSNDVIQMLLAYQRTISGNNAPANDSLAFDIVYTF